MAENILLVDDEPNILTAFKRQLRAVPDFHIETAPSGQAALELMASHSPFAVIVSDMRMPGMDGVALLREVQKKHENTVRIMLTGVTDQTTAIDAVNEGHIFRFLNKPCSVDVLSRSISDGVKQYKLITAEKELLQHTLSGSVRMLTDLLSMIDPAGFGHAVSLREPIREMAHALGLASSWDIELAAMLSQIGRVIIPSTIAAKVQQNQHLMPEEQEILQQVPEAGHKLLSNIPRLEKVAQIVLNQCRRFDGSGYPANGLSGDKIPLGARMITLLRDYEALRGKSANPLAELRKHASWYDPALMQLLENIASGRGGVSAQPVVEVYELHLKDLVAGQKLLADVETRDGTLLIANGTVLTEMAINRLANYAKLVGIKEPVKVNCRMPTRDN